MQIRILGPLEVFVAGQPLALGTPKQRAVLALLLARAGTMVPVEEIIEELWDQRPPASAAANARMYAASLRRLLARASETGGSVLVRRGAGYVFTVDEAEFDLARFRGLVRRARVCDDASSTAALLVEAVELWRGPAAADVPAGPVLAAWRVAVEEERLIALEDLGAALLAAGEPAGAAARVREVLTTHPLRERAYAALMRALYAEGDGVGALAAFDAAQRILADQLGVGPGEELRQLRQSVIDGTLGPTPSTSTSDLATGSVVPRQLPADIVSFTGRAGPLRKLASLLPDGVEPRAVVISAIAGTAGVGKTALAVHWAHQVSERFPDGQLYVNLRGFDPSGSPMDAAEALRGFLEALDVPAQRIPSSVEARAGLFRSLLAGRRMLVVLDNARSSEQVRPLLPGAPGCLALVTSRNDLIELLAAEGAQLLALDLLTAGEARQLLAKRIGPRRVAAEPEAAVDEIITCCARLPLALAVAAARAATQPIVPLNALAAELRDSASQLDVLDTGEAATDVRAVFSWSYRMLSSGAAKILRLLALHPGPDVTAPAVASMAALSLDGIRPLLTELIRAHMITEHVSGRFGFHDLLRAYAAEIVAAIDSESERDAATRRIIGYYLHAAHAADRILYAHRDRIALSTPDRGIVLAPPADSSAATMWFAAEFRVLLAVLELAGSKRYDDLTWQMSWILNTYVDRGGYREHHLKVQLAGLSAAQRLDSTDKQAHSHRAISRAYARLGRFDEADRHGWAALELFGALDDVVGMAHAHGSLSLTFEWQGRHEEALVQATEAYQLFRRAGNRTGEAYALSSIAWHQSLLGNHQQAITHCEYAISLHQKNDDGHGEAVSLHSLGHAHHCLGQYRQAVRCYERALDLLRLTGHRQPEVRVLVPLGDAHRALGESSAARAAWEEALAILADAEDADVDAEAIRAKLDELVIEVSARAGVQPPSPD